jgi:ribonucleoside-triphosphate reductase
MNTLQEINDEIRLLKEKLSGVKGRNTEVYSRIVGYYRSINNWNKGKRAEFDVRRTFEVPENAVETIGEYRAKETALIA